MRLAVIWSALLISFAITSSAQSHGYVFIAPGGATDSGHTDTTLQLGVGGEGVFAKGIGVGADIGYLYPTAASFSSGLGSASVNGFYHFNHKHVRLDPYVTGGYSILFRSGHLNLLNVGAGANWWFARHFGLRFEFRDNMHVTSGDNTHFWGFRFGLDFR